MVILKNKFKYCSSLLIFLALLFPEKKYIDVITTNDVHGSIHRSKAYFINPNFPATIVGGAGLYKYVKDIEKKLKNSSDDILMLDAGNFFQGSPIGVVDSGKTIIEWMNRLGYDALVPGEDDFVFGYKNLIKLSERADFPFLAANVYNKEGKHIFSPYEIVTIKDVNIGIIGIVDNKISDFELKKNIEGIIFKSTVKSLHEWVPVVQNAGADIIVVLTSLGVPFDREDVYKEISKNIKNPHVDYFNAIELGYYADDVSFIIAGGYPGYDLPWYDRISHTYIFQNYGNEFGHFKIKFDQKSKLFTGYESAKINDVNQSLFDDDFSYDLEQFQWIEEQYQKALNKINQTPDWSKVIISESEIEHKKNKEYIWDIPTIDNVNGLDVVTWNCEFFPANGDSTIQALSEAVNDLYPDIIGFQEIRKKGWFSKLMEFLPDYEFVISENSSFLHQAFIYKKDLFDLVNYKELFIGDTYFFAGRPPIQCDLIYKKNNLKLSLINIHMKCCGPGLERRKKASKQLYDYISNEIQKGVQENFIVLGDWNDDLKDDPGEHCFDLFLNDERFYFPTIDIVYDINQASYPKEPYVSFLDHIMISKSLISNSSYIVKTIPIDKYMGGFPVYERNISDHMPVLLSISNK